MPEGVSAIPVTISELANRLSLSKGTVSRVLNRRNDDLISESTRSRVILAAREAGYRPNRAARSLATGRTQTIAFYTNELTDISSAVVNRLQWLARHSELDMIIHNFPRHYDGKEEHVISPVGQADGIVAYEPHEYIHLIPDASLGERTPMVSMGTYLMDDTDFVGTNLIPEIEKAVEHLAAIGCRRIAYVEDHPTSAAPDFRHQTYAGAMQQAGLRPEYIDVPGSRAAARSAVTTYVRTNGSPDGMLCRYDDLAIGAYRGLRDLGLRIPDDVALIGCDGIDDTEYLDPPLSTIVQPIERMCDLAWEFLQKRMADPGCPLQQIVLPSCLELRASSLRSPA